MRLSGRDVVEARGGRVVRIELSQGFSTTELIRRSARAEPAVELDRAMGHTNRLRAGMGHWRLPGVGLYARTLCRPRLHL